MEEHNTDRWKILQREKMERGELVCHVFKRRRASKWLTETLKAKKTRYRDLTVTGAGETRIITTDIEHCPCCRQAYPVNKK